MLRYGVKSILSFVRLWGCVILCILFISKASAQIKLPLEDTIKTKLQAYQKLNPSAVLFAHFDKTIYTTNENVWFTAYLLNAANVNEHNTLSVSLINDIDRTEVMEDKFVMASGFGFGNMFLPDSIPPGNYTFMLYTNKVAGLKPQVMFTQPITLKSTDQTELKAILSLQDTANYKAGKPSRVLLTVNGSDYLPVANAEVNYTLAGTDTGVVAAKAKTDKTGQYLIPLPAGKNIVKVQVKSKKLSQYLYLALPQNNERAQVKFYPEGGSLVNDMPLRVGWEVTTPGGLPLRVAGLLYQNNKLIDTIKTDSYGMGLFPLTPSANSNYTVKLLGINQANTEYTLPKVLPAGMSITIHKALVDDTLHVQVRSSYAGKVYLNVHNYQQEFFCVPIDVEAYSPRRIKIAVTSLPKGIATVTLTDSLGRPFAERLFFARHNQRDEVNIRTDKNTYNTREKVTLKIRMGDDAVSNQGALSVACVQDNRIELKKVNDIETHFYLKNALSNIPMREHYLTDNDADKQFLEQVLLIKGWRKYTWPELISLKNTLIKDNADSLIFSGKILNNNKPLKKPVTFMLFKNPDMAAVTTDAGGGFPLTYQQLITTQDKQLKFVTGTDRIYNVIITDPYLNINKQAAQGLNFKTYEQALSTLYTDNFAIKGLEKTIKLAEVKVVANKDRLLRGSRGMGANDCGDYVCAYNILNCPNHTADPNNTIPIEGQYYMMNGRRTMYHCMAPKQQPIKAIRGIYVAKQYYGSDYSVTNPSEPEYVSTIFWRHLIKVESGKDAEMEFYTSDITGKFRIVVQGITSNGVTYNERYITVKKP